MLIPFTSASFTNVSGLAVANGAEVEVRLESNGALAALFDDRDGTTPLTNPFNADIHGRFAFYVAGRLDGYSIEVTKDAQSHILHHQLTNLASSTIYTQSGSGAVSESLEEALRRFGKSVESFGAVGDGVANDTAAIQAADTAAGSGGLVLFTAGRIYKWTGDLTPGLNRHWLGLGGVRNTAPKLKAGDSTARLLLTNACRVEKFYIEGSTTSSPFAGTGVQVGNTDFVGHVTLVDVFVRHFQTNLRLAAALWTVFDRCEFLNGRVGVDFNAGGASMFSTTVTFRDCVIADNERQGVTASNTPHVNQAIHFFGGTIQANATESDIYNQFEMPDTNGFSLRGLYFEPHSTGDGKIMDISSMEGGVIDGCFSQSFSTAVFGSDGTVIDVVIKGNYFAAITGTYVVDITNATRVEVSSLRTNKPVNLTGTQVVDGQTGAIVVQPVNQESAVPTLIGSSVAGTQTYTNQTMSWNQIGNQVFFRGRISISAKDGAMAGNVQIALGDLPNSVSDGQAFALVQIEPNNGVTFDSGYTFLMGEIAGTGTNKIDLLQCGSNVSALNLPVSGIAATTTFRFAGVYTTG